MIPAFEAQAGAPANAGAAVAKDLRSLLTGMATHTSVPEGEIKGAMKRNGVEQLDAITSRQLAQAMGAELSAWGTVQSGGQGLEADVTFTDVRSGDEIVLDDVTAPNAKALAQAIFQGFEQKVEGIRMAAFCNDYLASQQYDRALETCNQALAIVPTSTTALYGKATALYNMDNFAESLATYRQLLEVDPNHQDALLGAGLAASRLDQGQEALGFYNRYLELNPLDVQVRMKVAGDIAQAGDFISAYRVLQPAATAENAENLDFQKYYAQVATAAGQRVEEAEGKQAAAEYYNTALAAYDRVFAAQPDSLDASLYRQAIAVNNGLGRTQEALRLGQQATQQFDTVASVWAQYGDVLREAKQYGEAARAYTKVIQLDPQYEGVYIRRALAYMEGGQRQQALADLERAAGQGNREQVARAIFSMASAPLNSGNYAEAANLLSMANNYATGSLKSEIGFFWGFSLYRQGEAIAKANTQGSAARAREALKFFQQALPLLQASNHQNAAQVAGASQQYIANQEAIIKAGG
jgi:tetratricopeptide (TPR) repeat protein